MAAPIQTLEDWLSERLLAENKEVDLEIFVPYVTGILDTDTSIDDKRESLEEVLEQVVESGQEKLCADIINQWESRNIKTEEPDKDKNLELKLSQMLVDTNVAVVKTRILTAEEKARKAAIIAQYEQLSDGEGEDEPVVDVGAKGGAKGGAGAISAEDWMMRNVNSLNVLEAEKEKRDKSKLEHEQKKEKDRSDRDAQKQKQQDRKEGEKKRTQKGEKRR